MVFIRLSSDLQREISSSLSPALVHRCQNATYISYKNFKAIAKTHPRPIHTYVRNGDIVSNLQFEVILRESQRTPEQRQIVLEMQNKHEQRSMGLAQNKANYYFEAKTQGGVKEMTDSISFGMSFIFSFFMAGITGYYFGSYFLGYQLAQALMVALAFIVLTIIIQTTLFILKQAKKSKDSQQRHRKEKTKQDEKNVRRTMGRPNEKNKKQ